jgi:hypothetical protein
MNATLETMTVYSARVAPGLREAMTPLGLWSFGRDGFFWIRLDRDPCFLVVFGAACLAISLGLYFLDRENRDLLQWTRGNIPLGLIWGIGGAAVVVAPFAAIYQYTPIDLRGGIVPAKLLPAILAFALLGNLLEEALFRGYVYGLLAKTVPPIKAGIASGVVFAFCHAFLATTVTGIGCPLLVFTLWEGVIAGIVGAKAGVVPSSVTHGRAIFLLASGLI